MTVVTRQNVIDFLYQEAMLLDEWKLIEWTELFIEDATYIIPPIGEPEANPITSIFYINDDRNRLQDRAERLLKKEAHVEYPHSSTIRNYHNIKVDNLDTGVISVECNFTAHRTKREVVDTFIGKQEFKLVVLNKKLAIKSKKVILNFDSLRPHGKISLIL
ncbi:aromatic-ring-hydroxylating dioxygenase subunit beta [Virgibacillus pantothenticus]|uniref:aromatic-ring-hydroxylating dioxygenase subunit beta n=1 Tax=Virgibacillus TaxID=84406 RepID=UPI00090A5749|nr:MULTISPECIES: aromatic-ring-hydroxylating dioxygenase subunit beta [Virgibacillus]API92028.1 p-cumate dioxygenase [Virgibacillus sp. 6R]MBS7430493.1 aromatic-ring-hydroxylating dioxygenase subunit beta [Virgibacillus sp. 19R1-5]MBU8566431.1 aromatic-ring-hydroxylating dioxygenase subunit beta [Virgibacillus pantothenticus]MBU8600154.1 aromatic-ring-hydroxylating dioxygenase subunit beta [Virgibacillus pantothenticus]MBU8633914.1 aromatic-ring-hydroxylating dioxygenase subunit beta [Virgibac